ncbi:RhuM family protein [Fibrobacter sp. UWH4]|uniref:RhuM family protein n=1 Tax=Fibrobacter sp. UWH4 TaxID=1896210 RepID=UPI0009127287|nr:RhuM family protein [Fibrobacter sp. UWH4]SHL66724.1 Virulence protein RhuM family protein [Fibrobacter sp. UWH4]
MSKKDKIEIRDQVGNENRGEIVLYQPEGEVRLEVRVENETVWLTANQMARLFNRDEKTLRKHINNVFSEEVEKDNNTHFLRVDGVKQPVAFYSLDVIISVGYRVKSASGVKFRRWANQVLKEYMLKGYAINQRKISTDLQIVDRLHEQRQLIEDQGAEIAEFRNTTEKRLGEQDSRLSAVEQRIDFFVNAAQTPTGGILATGTRFDGFVLISDLVKRAKKSVVFIDPYATIEVLKFAAMRAKGVSAKIYSSRITPEFKTAADLHKKQYPELELKTMRTIHDRFLLVDDTVYHFGASFKDMGNEMTAFSVLDFVTPAEVIAKVEQNTKGK